MAHIPSSLMVFGIGLLQAGAGEAERGIPPIDRTQSKEFYTATFAMG